MALFCKGRCHTGHNKHVLSMKTKCQVPLSQSINPFSLSATNTSIYHTLMIMHQALHIFAPYSPWHNLQQFKYSKTSTVYILLTGLCASCFCTVWPGWKCGWERIWLVSMQAASIASKIKHTDVYHQDSNYNCLYLLYYTYYKQTLQPIRSLAHCTLEHNTNNTHNVCITAVCKVCKSTPINTQKCNFQHTFTLHWNSPSL